MSEFDKHEWAAGVHAAIFSLLTGLAAIHLGLRVPLALALLSQGLAYVGRFAAISLEREIAAIINLVSIFAATLAAIFVVWS